jgi:hypothetical protein
MIDESKNYIDESETWVLPFEEHSGTSKTLDVATERYPLIALTRTSESLPRASRAVLVERSRHGLRTVTPSRHAPFAVFDARAASSR